MQSVVCALFLSLRLWLEAGGEKEEEDSVGARAEDRRGGNGKRGKGLPLASLARGKKSVGKGKGEKRSLEPPDHSRITAVLRDFIRGGEAMQ